MNRPQTIQIFLPSGDPRGLRVAEITTRIVRVVEVPRSLLTEFLKMPEADQVGVYFLVSDAADTGQPQLYVGQSGNVGARLVQQNQTKDFWNRALVLTSLTNSMTQTHGLFLEWCSIAAATKAERYQLENGNGGARPFTPAPLEADCMEIHETAATLLATLGHPIFEPLRSLSFERPGSEVLYCRASGADARGLYTPEGFVVLKGSRGRIENVNSIRGEWAESVRLQLAAEGVVKEIDGVYEFTRDHLFGSPSTAGIAVTGRRINGWDHWKDANGHTLNELKRNPI